MFFLITSIILTIAAFVALGSWIDKWNGKMPTYYGGDADLMFNMGGNTTTSEVKE